MSGIPGAEGEPPRSRSVCIGRNLERGAPLAGPRSSIPGHPVRGVTV